MMQRCASAILLSLLGSSVFAEDRPAHAPDDGTQTISTASTESPAQIQVLQVGLKSKLAGFDFSGDDADKVPEKPADTAGLQRIAASAPRFVALVGQADTAVLEGMVPYIQEQLAKDKRLHQAINQVNEDALALVTRTLSQRARTAPDPEAGHAARALTDGPIRRQLYRMAQADTATPVLNANFDGAIAHANLDAQPLSSPLFRGPPATTPGQPHLLPAPPSGPAAAPQSATPASATPTPRATVSPSPQLQSTSTSHAGQGEVNSALPSRHIIEPPAPGVGPPSVPSSPVRQDPKPVVAPAVGQAPDPGAAQHPSSPSAVRISAPSGTVSTSAAVPPSAPKAGAPAAPQADGYGAALPSPPLAQSTTPTSATGQPASVTGQGDARSSAQPAAAPPIVRTAAHGGAGPDYNAALPSRHIHEPPSPTPAAAVKGVRIGYDPVVLDLACRASGSLDAFEDHLLGDSAASRADPTAWLTSQAGAALATEGIIDRTIGRPTLVSLGALATNAEPYRDHWQNLPEALRHPGGMRRIHGIVIVQTTGDIVLVGDRSGGGPPIDIDDVTVGLRAVWRDGSVPGCSLEPEPEHMGGPQHALVLGVERDSTFALTMLDADYLMKLIMFGLANPASTTVTSYLDAVVAENARVEQTSTEHALSRFWFTAVAPAEGGIRLSHDRVMALFDARMQVVTERMTTIHGNLAALDSQDPQHEIAAASMSRHLDELEQEFPILRQLHALYDIALTAAVLKRLGPDPGVIERICALPFSARNVPASYTGLTTSAPLLHGQVFTISGGVHMLPGMTAQTLVAMDSPDMDVLRARLPVAAQVTEDIDDRGIHAPSTTASPSAHVAAPHLQHDRATLTRLCLSAAPAALVRELGERIDVDPADPQLRVLRSRAYARMGCAHLAEREARAAAVLGDDSVAARPALLRALLEQHAIQASALEPIDAASVSVLYRDEAAAQLPMHPEDAVRTAHQAVSLCPNDPIAVGLEQRSLVSCGRFPEALALLDRLIAAQPRAADWQLSRATVLGHLERWPDALRALDQVIALYPSAEAFIMRAQARYESGAPNLNPAFDDLRHAEDLEPANAEIPLARARLLDHEGDADAALAAVTRAITLEPGLARALSLRANLRMDSAIPRRSNELTVRKVPMAADALTDLNHAISEMPTDALAHVLRARLILAILGDLLSRRFTPGDLVTLQAPVAVALSDAVRAPAAASHAADLPLVRLLVQLVRHDLVIAQGSDGMQKHRIPAEIIDPLIARLQELTPP